jgi:hypothetical protein
MDKDPAPKKQDLFISASVGIASPVVSLTFAFRTMIILQELSTRIYTLVSSTSEVYVAIKSGTRNHTTKDP